MNLKKKEQEEIVITVDEETGAVKVEGFGFTGKECLSTMKALEESLTSSATIKPKKAMHEKAKEKKLKPRLRAGN